MNLPPDPAVPNSISDTENSDMSKEAAAKAQAIKKNHPELFAKPPKTLARKVTDSSLYDMKPTARFLLLELVVLAMDEDSNYPDNAPPEYRADKEGWCWMSQEQLGWKVGVVDTTIYRWIKRFRKDGVIEYRDWYDENHTHHAEYKVVDSVVDAFQRVKGEERPSRYAEGSRKGKGGSKQRSSKGTFMKVVEDED